MKPFFATKVLVFVRKGLEFLPLVILCVMLMAGLFVTPQELPQHSLCIFKNIFQFDCPGCGMTRAFLLIPRGDFSRAIQYNAASLPLYFLFILGLVTLLQQKLNFKLEVPKFVCRFRFFLGQVTLVLVTIHWGCKIYSYFQTHSISQYLSLLIKSRQFWLFLS